MELLRYKTADLNSMVHCRRYGLVGPNGSGKSTLLKALGNREVPIPEHIDIYFLDREIPATDMTALEAVMSVDSERQRLEKEAESLLGDDSEEAQARLEDVYERWGLGLTLLF
jgi:ATP-binding cassette subfamily F protein 2